MGLMAPRKSTLGLNDPKRYDGNAVRIVRVCGKCGDRVDTTASCCDVCGCERIEERREPFVRFRTPKNKRTTVLFGRRLREAIGE